MTGSRTPATSMFDLSLDAVRRGAACWWMQPASSGVRIGQPASATKKKAGRPRSGLKRPVLAMRVHDDLLEMLRASAARKRLTLSEDAAERLARSFELEALAVKFGSPCSGSSDRGPEMIIPRSSGVITPITPQAQFEKIQQSVAGLARKALQELSDDRRDAEAYRALARAPDRGASTDAARDEFLRLARAM